MVWPFSKADSGLNQAASALSPFIHAALSDLEEPALHGPGSSRKLAECYVYGAIRYLASYDDLRPGCTGVLLKTLLIKHFDANSDEVSDCLVLFSGAPEGGKEQLFMIEGASALRRWLVNGDRTVASELRRLLDKNLLIRQPRGRPRVAL